MKIKPMLARLESAMGRHDLVEQMVLLAEPASSHSHSEKSSAKPMNLVVGYNSSPRSQTALDLTLWIAHQTRLVSRKKVTVQVVYVVDEKTNARGLDIFSLPGAGSSSKSQIPSELSKAPAFSASAVLAQPEVKALAANARMTSVDRRNYKTLLSPSNQFEQADKILWQARCLAEEWRGSFTAHLRFGCVAEELRKVVESEAADVLFLGCHSADHPIIRKLGAKFPCSVLGIPSALCSEEKCSFSSEFSAI
ncbi:universal stress protein [Microcoleus sp. FACHB-672]|uniref:universal stress protein n=1 Tax=Microcoleus sp. FACHB-672 TaxID=2692825 RepID=UPI002815CBC4|nr:universal stress protein [Microcoleus sp. FACHB-672]